MKRAVLATFSVIVVAIALVGNSVQFNKLTTGIIGTTLTVDFKATGLGNDPGTVTLADDVTVTCLSRGKNGTQQDSATTKLLTTENFTPHNGSYNGGISFTGTCPDHQSAENPIFRNVTITIATPAGSACAPVTNGAGSICSQAGGTATCSPLLGGSQRR